MYTITYDRKDIINKQSICIRGIVPADIFINVTSSITGATKLFVYDGQLTEEECVNNEGWDGEEKHRYYRSDDGTNIILDVWHSADDERYGVRLY